MTREEIRQALLDVSDAPKVVRTNDGRVFRVEGRERWAIGTDRLVVLVGAATNTLSIRNIASIGPSGRRGRKRQRRK